MWVVHSQKAGLYFFHELTKPVSLSVLNGVMSKWGYSLVIIENTSQ